MSRSNVLNLIRRVENLADTIPDINTEAEANAIAGQLNGTMNAIVREFEKNGISVQNEILADSANRLARTGDKGEAQYLAQSAAAYFRGMLDEL